MAAGLGFKTFTTGEVLTAADTNGYLMQGINVFATTAARDAAITAPAEGQFAFTKDTNSLWYFDGAAWVASGATGDIEGVTAGIGISGGGTSGTVTVTNSMATAIDAKGDLVAGTGADAFSKLTVGANDTVLTADSAQATGLKWASPTAATTSFALINSGGTALTGSGTTTVSFSGKNQIAIVVTQASTVSGNVDVNIRLNTDGTSFYDYYGLNFENNALQGYGGNFPGAATSWPLGRVGTTATTAVGGIVLIDGANSTNPKFGVVNGYINTATGGNQATTNNVYTGTSALTSISIVSSSGNFDAGRVYVYGA